MKIKALLVGMSKMEYAIEVEGSSLEIGVI